MGGELMYQIVEFDGVTLPVYNPQQDHTGPLVESTLLPSLGGTFDYWGSRQRRGRQAQFSITGEYWAEATPTYLVDHLSNNLADESGNQFIAGTPGALLRSQLDALRAKRGVRGKLWRVRLDDNTRQWIDARLLSVEHRQVVDDRTDAVRLACTFETAMDAWRNQLSENPAGLLIDGASSLLIDNEGFTVEDAIIRIGGSSGGVSSVAIVNSAMGIDLRYTGLLQAGQFVLIDCGAQTVRLIGLIDDYAHFSLGPGHTARSWCPLAPGPNVFQLTSNASGFGSIQVTYYPQRP